MLVMDEITDLQAIVLGWFIEYGAGRAEEIAVRREGQA